MTSDDPAMSLLPILTWNSSTAAPHPEEMRETVRFRIGKSMSIDATARATGWFEVTRALLINKR